MIQMKEQKMKENPAFTMGILLQLEIGLHMRHYLCITFLTIVDDLPLGLVIGVDESPEKFSKIVRHSCDLVRYYNHS